MALTVRQFIELHGVTPMEAKKEMAGAMFRLAETDKGMRDLLDKATTYYHLRTEKND